LGVTGNDTGAGGGSHPQEQVDLTSFPYLFRQLNGQLCLADTAETGHYGGAPDGRQFVVDRAILTVVGAWWHGAQPERPLYLRANVDGERTNGVSDDAVVVADVVRVGRPNAEDR